MRERRTNTRVTTAQALRDLIRAELAHERVARTDEAQAAQLEQQVNQAREHYRRLAGVDA